MRRFYHISLPLFVFKIASFCWKSKRSFFFFVSIFLLLIFVRLYGCFVVFCASKRNSRFVKSNACPPIFIRKEKRIERERENLRKERRGLSLSLSPFMRRGWFAYRGENGADEMFLPCFYFSCDDKGSCKITVLVVFYKVSGNLCF